MKLLVLATKYPNQNGQSMMYVHVRNKYYVNNGIDVDVISFETKTSYLYEGINVMSLDDYKKSNKQYDVLVCHAANVKEHYLFIKKYNSRFRKIVMFYHGHEILKLSDVYPRPYSWKKNKNIFLQDLYDDFKFALWKRILTKNLKKMHLVFVSNWLYERFLYYIHINPYKLENKHSIINNSVGEIFETKQYDMKSKKKYDFITIRGSSLDGSKYGVDIVYNLALKYPNYKFLIVGKGDFFEHNKLLDNIEYIPKSLTHDEMINYINMSKFALLPTREDTQGVLTCEMFSFGIPTITSNIEVCREIFSGIENVRLIDNDVENVDIDLVINELDNSKKSYNKKYFKENTIQMEIELYEKIMKEDDWDNEKNWNNNVS